MGFKKSKPKHPIRTPTPTRALSCTPTQGWQQELFLNFHSGGLKNGQKSTKYMDVKYRWYDGSHAISHNRPPPCEFVSEKWLKMIISCQTNISTVSNSFLMSGSVLRRRQNHESRQETDSSSWPLADYQLISSILLEWQVGWNKTRAKRFKDEWANSHANRRTSSPRYPSEIGHEPDMVYLPPPRGSFVDHDFLKA